jgi:hypothetical protein
MKRLIRFMKNMPGFSMLWFVILLAGSVVLQAQDEENTSQKDTRPIRNTFESIWLIDNQTVMVPIKGTFEMDFQHRFGIWKNGYDDFYGVFAPSNMRIGLNYTPIEKLQVGFGFTKERLVWDFQAKYALFRQGRSGGSPVSVTYLVNAGIDTRKKEKTQFKETTDRFSYFHQLMVARKITDAFSLQAAGSLSYFNFVEKAFDEEQNMEGRMNNKHFAVAFMGRYKISDVVGVIVNYDLPLSDHEFNKPEGNLAFGIELVSSSHAFQLFAGNYKSLIPQLNNALNQNDYGKSEFLIGFNITRLWNF